jgi:hypothetical protein
MTESVKLAVLALNAFIICVPPKNIHSIALLHSALQQEHHLLDFLYAILVYLILKVKIQYEKDCEAHLRKSVKYLVYGVRFAYRGGVPASQSDYIIPHFILCEFLFL